MVKKENNWIAWAALAIALVALISVLGNAYLTGNFIRVNNLGALGKSPVYTKADIDKMLSKLDMIYVDPLDCFSATTIISNLQSQFASLDCGDGVVKPSVISQPIVTCVDSKDFPLIVGEVFLPNFNAVSGISYSCVNPSTGAKSRPNYLGAKCCVVKTR